MGGAGVCSLANLSAAYEETQSNTVSDFRDFVCFLFPKAILFYFYLIHLTVFPPFVRTADIFCGFLFVFLHPKLLLKRTPLLKRNDPALHATSLINALYTAELKL